jgi:hypothetical protein
MLDNKLNQLQGMAKTTTAYQRGKMITVTAGKSLSAVQSERVGEMET